MNIDGVKNGIVLDHIKAGKSLSIYKHLGLDKLDCTVAIIKNAKSEKMGKKDILKVECDINTLNLDILGFIDHNITVNVIKNCEIVEKLPLSLPKEITSGASIHAAAPAATAAAQAAAATMRFFNRFGLRPVCMTDLTVKGSRRKDTVFSVSSYSTYVDSQTLPFVRG